jgi:hypothetical protein
MMARVLANELVRKRTLLGYKVGRIFITEELVRERTLLGLATTWAEFIAEELVRRRTLPGFKRIS